MLYEILAVVCGGVVGFAATWKFVSTGLKEEKKKEEEIRKAKISSISTAVERKVAESRMAKPPSDLSEFVNYLSDKYILGEITILTPEGLPVVSNSSTAEEDAAIAPEILRVARRLLNSNRIVLSGEDSRILVMQANPDVILHAKIARDISKKEMDRIRDEINMVMEGLI
ncbi:hypothetical protein [Archaeoglobus sp.]